MKWKFGTSHQLFYFQVKEPPTPLNILIPTPASDHLLRGHNENQHVFTFMIIKAAGNVKGSLNHDSRLVAPPNPFLRIQNLKKQTIENDTFGEILEIVPIRCLNV